MRVRFAKAYALGLFAVAGLGSWLCTFNEAQAGFDHVWSQIIPSDGSDAVTGLEVYPDGSFVVSGTFDDRIDLGEGYVASLGFDDSFLARYDSNGVLQWARYVRGPSFDVIRDLGLDAFGNVYICGEFRSETLDLGGEEFANQGNYDLFVAKYTVVGEHEWSLAMGGPGREEGKVIAVWPAGRVLACGVFYDPFDPGDGTLVPVGGAWDTFALELDTDGSLLWSAAYGGQGAESVFGAVVDASSDVILTGSFDDDADFGGGALQSSGGRDVFVARLTVDGAHVWSMGYGAHGIQEGTDVAVDALGRVFFTGTYHEGFSIGSNVLDATGGRDIFLASLAADGSVRWAQGFGSTEWDRANSVTVDALGKVAFTGGIAGAVDFGGGPLPAGPSEDVFVAQFGPNGDHLGSMSFPADQAEYGQEIASDALGNLILCGTTRDSISFGGPTLIPTEGSRNIFQVEFGLAPSGVVLPVDPAVRPALRVVPNPLTRDSAISFRVDETTPAKLRVFDASGRWVTTLLDGVIVAGEHEAVWRATDHRGRLVPAGSYLLSLETAGSTRAARVLVVQ